MSLSGFCVALIYVTFVFSGHQWSRRYPNEIRALIVKLPNSLVDLLAVACRSSRESKWDLARSPSTAKRFLPPQLKLKLINFLTPPPLGVIKPKQKSTLRPPKELTMHFPFLMSELRVRFMFNYFLLGRMSLGIFIKMLKILFKNMKCNKTWACFYVKYSSSSSYFILLLLYLKQIYVQVYVMSIYLPCIQQ